MKVNLKHPTCPVCYYCGPGAPQELYDICDCCGTEIGFSDYSNSYEDLRNQWENNGCPWFYGKEPKGWSHSKQLASGAILWK